MSAAEHAPHDHGSERQAGKRPPGRHAMSPVLRTGDVAGLFLQMQRTAGNAAVNQLIARLAPGRHVPITPGATPSPSFLAPRATAARERPAPDPDPPVTRSPGAPIIQRNLFADAKPRLQKMFPNLAYTYSDKITVAKGDTRSVGDAMEKFWREYIGMAPENLIAEMLQGIFPPGAPLTKDPVSVSISKGDLNKEEVQVTIIIADGQPNRLVVARTFKWEGGKLTVHEDRTDVGDMGGTAGKGSRQGGGRALYRGLLPLYQKLKASRITLEATAIGKYAWARFGFLPRDKAEWDTIRRQINERLDGLVTDAQAKEAGAAMKAWTGAADLKKRLQEKIAGVLGDIDTRIKADSAVAPPGEHGTAAPERTGVEADLDEFVAGLVNECAEAALEALGEAWPEQKAEAHGYERLATFIEKLKVQIKEEALSDALIADLKRTLLESKGGSAPLEGGRSALLKPGIAPDIAIEIERVLQSDEREALPKLAELVGKGDVRTILLNLADWHGSINLESPGEVARLKAYIGAA